MSAQPTAPDTAPDMVSIEIDGRELKAPKGSMIIEAADKAGIPIPRFCYHPKLAIAANCRMCLVDVEKAPKPMPACATPVGDGMKVYTQSKRALDAQRNVMEFLLINHPLDCPICDQGGECELQDLALGYGRSVSRFTERKRVVPDEDLGPLISTDMTRCIHCTRCVRVSAEICGSHELGGMGRGEHLEIGTYIGKALESELSGNVIDVCPVGALTNKVFRFRARPWELTARESLGYHDALGSNLYLHTRRGEVLRCVPRDHAAINECWLSDRDRWSHQGLAAADRALRPLVRDAGGALREVDWDAAIGFVADGLDRARKQHGAEQIGALVGPMTPSEEGFLLARLVRGLGSQNIDHRLRAADLADGEGSRAFEMPLAAIGEADAILVIGGHPRHDQPILGHRIRQAARRGAAVFAVNPIDFATHYEQRRRFIVGPWDIARVLAGIAAATSGEGRVPDAVADLVRAATPDEGMREVADVLGRAGRSVIVFGDFAVQHPAASMLRALARCIASATGSAFDELPQGANAVGLAQTGVLPGPGGLHAAAMLARPRKALIVHQAELLLDAADGLAAADALPQTQFLVALTGHAPEALKAVAHAILPIGLVPEIDGTLVNADGTAQAFAAGARLPGEARAGWRVLRALGAALGLDGFAAESLDEVRAAMAAAPAFARAGAGAITRREPRAGGTVRVATVPIYRVDAVVRRAPALQATPLARAPRLVLHPGDALAKGLGEGAQAAVSDGTTEIVLPVETAIAVPHGVAWIEAAHPETALLGGTGVELTLRKV